MNGMSRDYALVILIEIRTEIFSSYGTGSA
jgi:hypothetical protein